MKISLLLVTHGRHEIVERSAQSTLEGGVDEIVWVDNGSSPSEYEALCDVLPEPVVDVHLRSMMNRGVGWALNRAASLATGDVLLVTDGDLEFPEGTLDEMVSILSYGKEIAAVSCYVTPPEATPERFWSEQIVWHTGSKLTAPTRRGLPMICRMFRRQLFDIAGWFREDFGMVRWEDIEWAYRVKHYCQKHGLESLVLIDRQCIHLPDVMGEPESYKAAKQVEADDSSKSTRIQELAAQGWPRFYPFGEL